MHSILLATPVKGSLDPKEVMTHRLKTTALKDPACGGAGLEGGGGLMD